MAASTFAGSVVVTFPHLSEPGTWTVSHVLLANADGYSRFLSQEDLASLGLPTRLLVTSLTDTAKPTLTSLQFAPSTVDLTSGASEVTIQLEANDDISGVDAVEVSFNGPSGTQRLHASARLPRPLRSAKIPLVMTLAPSIEQGKWNIAAIVVTDAAGNTLTMDTDDLVRSGFPVSLMVNKIVDTSPPTLTAFEITPPRINVALGSATAKVNFTVADNLSGVVGVEVSFIGPSGVIPRKAEVRFKPAREFTGSAAVEFPPFSEPGEWEVAMVVLVDAAGNTQALSAADLAAKGFAHRLAVVVEPASAAKDR
jgi:hypothetical protein